jgi:hypothetical protein
MRWYIIGLVFIGWLMTGAVKAPLQPFPDCETFGKQIFDAMLNDPSELQDALIEMDKYHLWIESLEDLPEETKDAMKLRAIENYKQIRKNYRQECKRIHRLFADFKKKGGVLSFESCRVKDHKNFKNFGMFTIHYSGKVKRDHIRDAISFEVLVLNDTYFVVDGFFEKYD